MQREKSGANYRINAYEKPKLFKAFEILSETICKNEKQVNLTLVLVIPNDEYGTYTLIADSGYEKKARVDIPMSIFPKDLLKETVWTKGINNHDNAMINIQQIGSRDILVYPHNYIADGVLPIDYSGFFPAKSDVESMSITIRPQKEGETYKGTGGGNFISDALAIEQYTGRGIQRDLLRFIVDMKLTVIRYKQAEKRDRFLFEIYTDDFDIWWSLPGFESTKVKNLSSETVKDLESKGITADKDGNITVPQSTQRREIVENTEVGLAA